MTSIWGEEHDRRMAEFDRNVEAIEKKYSHLFENQINGITGQKPDKLTNHFIPQWEVGRYTIGFLKTSYVPDYIQKEVTQAFVSAFSDK